MVWPSIETQLCGTSETCASVGMQITSNAFAVVKREKSRQTPAHTYSQLNDDDDGDYCNLLFALRKLLVVDKHTTCIMYENGTDSTTTTTTTTTSVHLTGATSKTEAD